MDCSVSQIQRDFIIARGVKKESIGVGTYSVAAARYLKTVDNRQRGKAGGKRDAVVAILQVDHYDGAQHVNHPAAEIKVLRNEGGGVIHLDDAAAGKARVNNVHTTRTGDQQTILYTSSSSAVGVQVRKREDNLVVLLNVDEPTQIRIVLNGD